MREALLGKVTEHRRFMMRMLLDHVEYLERQIESFDQRIEQAMNPFEKQAVELLDTISGVVERATQDVVAEIGSDLEPLSRSEPPVLLGRPQSGQPPSADTRGCS